MRATKAPNQNTFERLSRHVKAADLIPLLHWEEGLGEEVASGINRAILLSRFLSSHVEERGPSAMLCGRLRTGSRLALNEAYGFRLSGTSMPCSS